MEAFLIYNSSTGIISSSYKVANHDVATAMSLNTPVGMATMQVDPSTPAVSNTGGWLVQTVDGTPTLVAVVPTASQTLASAKTTKLSTLQAEFDAARTKAVPYMGTNFMADDNSQKIFAHALTAYGALGSVPSDFYCVDVNYAKVAMTLAQLQGLGGAIAEQVWASYQRWIACREALAVASSISQVEAVTY